MSFRSETNVLTAERTDLLETKLVDILEDFKLDQNKKVTIKKEGENGSLILVKAETHDYLPVDTGRNDIKLPNWAVSPYDLGGHSPYFSSQKMFSSQTSFFFMIFSRYMI